MRQTWRGLILAAALIEGAAALLTFSGAFGASTTVSTPLLGAWRTLSALLFTMAALWQGQRRSAGMLGLAVAYLVLTVDLFAGDLTRGWAILLLGGPLLAGLVGLWAASAPRFASACATVASASLLVLIALGLLSRVQSSWDRPAHITIAILALAAVPVALRLLDEPMRAPGLGLLATLLLLIGAGAGLILAMVSLGRDLGLVQTWRILDWPLILVGAWLLVTSSLRAGSARTGTPVNLAGVAAGACGLIGGWLVLTSGGGTAFDAGMAMAFLLLAAIWTAWLSSLLRGRGGGAPLAAAAGDRQQDQRRPHEGDGPAGKGQREQIGSPLLGSAQRAPGDHPAAAIAGYDRGLAGRRPGSPGEMLLPAGGDRSER